MEKAAIQQGMAPPMHRKISTRSRFRVRILGDVSSLGSCSCVKQGVVLSMRQMGFGGSWLVCSSLILEGLAVFDTLEARVDIRTPDWK